MEVFAVRLRPWAVGAFTAHPAEWRDRLVGLTELGLELTADTFDDFAAQAEAKLTSLPLPDAAGTVQAAIAGMESGALALRWHTTGRGPMPKAVRKAEA